MSTIPTVNVQPRVPRDGDGVTVYAVSGSYPNTRIATDKQFYVGTDEAAATHSTIPKKEDFSTVIVREWVNGFHVRTMESSRSGQYQDWDCIYDLEKNIKETIRTLEDRLAEQRLMLDLIRPATANDTQL